MERFDLVMFSILFVFFFLQNTHNVFRTEQYNADLVLCKLKDSIQKKCLGCKQSE